MKQKNRREEDLPPSKGTLRLYLNDKKVPMLRSGLGQAGIGNELRLATQGGSIPVRVAGVKVAELSATQTEGVFELVVPRNTQLEVDGRYAVKAHIVVGQNPRRAERLELIG